MHATSRQRSCRHACSTECLAVALMKLGQSVCCAGMHRPVYTDSIYGNTLSGDVGFTQDLRAALERLFFQYEVRPPCMCCPACLSGAMPLRDSTPWSALLFGAVRKPRGGGCNNTNCYGRVLQDSHLWGVVRAGGRDLVRPCAPVLPDLPCLPGVLHAAACLKPTCN